jgi:hypothetical protein
MAVAIARGSAAAARSCGWRAAGRRCWSASASAAPGSARAWYRHYLFGTDDAAPELVTLVQDLLEETPLPSPRPSTGRCSTTTSTRRSRRCATSR